MALREHVCLCVILDCNSRGRFSAEFSSITEWQGQDMTMAM